jgi:hypothetical protein
MVIVDVRATGGRGDTGIPTDAYFAVEEIRDVSCFKLLFAQADIPGWNDDTTNIHPYPHFDRS